MITSLHEVIYRLYKFPCFWHYSFYTRAEVKLGKQLIIVTALKVNLKIGILSVSSKFLIHFFHQIKKSLPF